MSVKNRLLAFIKSCSTNQYTFEKKIGVSSGYVNNIRTSINPDKLEKISEVFPEFNIEWLMTGKGSMLKKAPVHEYNQHNIPLLPIAAQGGSLSNFCESVDLEKCEKVISPVKGAELAMEVAGDSMAPDYPCGSRIFIKKVADTSFLQWGKVFVLDTQEGSIIKQLRPTSEETPNKVKCISFHPDHDPFIVDLSKVYGIYKILARLNFSS